MSNEKVYLAMYNPMIHESSFGVISVHRSRKGAEMAMEFHKDGKHKEWERLYISDEDKEDFPFGSFEAWIVDEWELGE